MDNAEKFELLRDGVSARWIEYDLSNADYMELLDFLDDIEERWDMFEEES